MGSGDRGGAVSVRGGNMWQGGGTGGFLGNCAFLALIGQDLHVIILEPIVAGVGGSGAR